MKYRKCKYVLDSPAFFHNVWDTEPGEVIDTQYISLSERCLLLRTGFTWDGASGPAVDTPAFMQAALVHDALYWLHRMGLLDDRKQADQVMRKLCLENGMSKIRAAYAYHAVRLFGGRAARPTAETLHIL